MIRKPTTPDIVNHRVRPAGSTTVISCRQTLLGLPSNTSVHLGVTVIEVLFAMGIALVGLAGIAALLPLAQRQASNSFELTRAASMVENSLNEIDIGRTLDGNRLQVWNGSFQQPPPFAWQRADREWRLSNRFDISLGVNPVQPASLCVDPMFWGTQPLAISNSTPYTLNAYSPGLFPYYSQNYNPLSPPLAPRTWPTQPRMARATFGDPALPAGVNLNPNSNQRMSFKTAVEQFGATDDIVGVENEEDRSLNARRGFEASLKEASFGSLSQIITVAPVATVDIALFPTQSPLYVVSNVVFDKRTFDLIEPPTALGVPSQERLCWAVPPSIDTSAIPATGSFGEQSFDGSIGFDLNLYCSAEVDSDISIGDWILLGRSFVFGSGVQTNVFHWYQINNIDGEAEFRTGGFDPFGQAIQDQYWLRRVRVNGPDWIFQTGSGAGSRPTTASIISDVVTVKQTQLRID